MDVRLRPGASDEAIARAEAAMDVSFPADFRAWLTVHDGQERGTDIEWAPSCNILAPLDAMIKQWAEEKEGRRRGSGSFLCRSG